MIRKLIASANVATDPAAVEAGLAVLEAGGDFADGVIAYQGGMLGGEVFATFDAKAAELLGDTGHTVNWLQ